MCRDGPAVPPYKGMSLVGGRAPFGRTKVHRQAPYWSITAALVAHRKIAALVADGPYRGSSPALINMSEDSATLDRFLASCRPDLGDRDYGVLVEVTEFNLAKLRTATDTGRKTEIARACMRALNSIELTQRTGAPDIAAASGRDGPPPEPPPVQATAPAPRPRPRRQPPAPEPDPFSLLVSAGPRRRASMTHASRRRPVGGVGDTPAAAPCASDERSDVGLHPARREREEMSDLSAYEEERNANMARNREVLRALGLDGPALTAPAPVVNAAIFSEFFDCPPAPPPGTAVATTAGEGPPLPPPEPPTPQAPEPWFARDEMLLREAVRDAVRAFIRAADRNGYRHMCTNESVRVYITSMLGVAYDGDGRQTLDAMARAEWRQLEEENRQWVARERQLRDTVHATVRVFLNRARRSGFRHTVSNDMVHAHIGEKLGIVYEGERKHRLDAVVRSVWSELDGKGKGKRQG